MRDSTKVVIGFGSIWGLFAFGSLLFSSFTMGANDSAAEVVAFLLYGLTILPSCILAIWFTGYAAVWLMLITPLTAVGFVHQVIYAKNPTGQCWATVGSIAQALILAAIPGLIGLFLFRRRGEATKAFRGKSVNARSYRNSRFTSTAIQTNDSASTKEG
jgi:hypothetical protein